MTYEELLEDLNKEVQAAKKAGYFDAKEALVRRVFPLMESIILWTNEELQDLADSIDDDDDEGDDGLDEDLVLKITGLIKLGAMIAESIKDPEGSQKEMVDAYNAVAPEILKELLEVTSDSSEEETPEEVSKDDNLTVDEPKNS